jgi:hypothetical protein
MLVAVYQASSAIAMKQGTPARRGTLAGVSSPGIHEGGGASSVAGAEAVLTSPSDAVAIGPADSETLTAYTFRSARALIAREALWTRAGVGHAQAVTAHLSVATLRVYVAP